MSGPLKFWSSVIGAFVALAAFLLYIRPRAEQPMAAQDLTDPSVSATVPEILEVPDVPADLSHETEPGREVPDVEIPPTPNLIQGEMSTWARNYRAQMALLLAPLSRIEAAPAIDRSVCNDLLTATYNAQNQLQNSPDPDIEDSLDRALGTFAEAGKFCLQEKAGLRDTYLLLARASVTLVDKLLAERYSENGVPGLAEPMEGGTEIGRRALEFTETLKGEQDDP